MPVGLERHLGLGSAIALVVGEIIAVGIFLTPAGMMRSIGSPFWVLVVWLIMAAMALAGALCYAELAARFPEAGGGYVYLRETYGRGVAFLYGWKSLLVMDPGITAALGLGMAEYLSILAGISPGWARLIAVGWIVGIAAANIVGVRFASLVVRVLMSLKLGFLAAIIVLAFASGAGNWANFVPFVPQRSGSMPLVGALAGGMISAFFAFGGWWDLAKLGGEIKEPARVLPRALAAGISIVAAVYIATSAAFLYLVPLEQIADGAAFAAQAGLALFGQAGQRVFAAVVVVAIAGSLAGLMMAAPRVYFAMARDGLFISQLASIHPRYGTPARAIATQCLLACVLVAVGSFDTVIGYFIFVTVAFIGATAAGTVALRRESGPPDGYRPVWYPVPLVLFLLLTAGVLLLLVAGKPVQSMIGVAVTAAGIPVYRLLERQRARARTG